VTGYYSTSVLVSCSCFGFGPSTHPRQKGGGAQQPPTFRPYLL